MNVAQNPAVSPVVTPSVEGAFMYPRSEVSNPRGAPPPLRPYYSNAVRVRSGDLLFISGQVAWNEHGEIVGRGDAVAQAEQVFANLQVILDANGATWVDVVKATVYVTDLSWFEQLSDIRLRYFADLPPASAIVQVGALVDPDLMLEIEAVVAVRFDEEIR